MRKSKVYTRRGDDGTTSLAGGQRVSKSNDRVEAYGTVDELNSFVGLLMAQIEETAEAAFLQEVQDVLFALGAWLATPGHDDSMQEHPAVEAAQLQQLEHAIDAAEDGLPPWRGFILPGGSAPAALCHVCRTVCRRAERRIVALSQQHTVDATLMAYFNRLSDYFFVLSRRLLFNAGKEEIVWRKR